LSLEASSDVVLSRYLLNNLSKVRGKVGKRTWPRSEEKAERKEKEGVGVEV